MAKITTIIITFFLAACAADAPHNEKNIPIDTGAQPQSNVIISAPSGTMGHGRF